MLICAQSTLQQNLTLWMQNIVGRAWVSCTLVWKCCWVWARSKQTLPTSNGRQTESSYICTAVFSQHHHNKMVLHRFVLITTCNICTLYLSWHFACFITYNFTCVSARPHSGCMHNAPAVPQMQCFTDAMFHTCVILHAQIIYGLVSVGHTYVHMWVYDVVSGLMTSHPWQIDTAWLRTVWGEHD